MDQGLPGRVVADAIRERIDRNIRFVAALDAEYAKLVTEALAMLAGSYERPGAQPVDFALYRDGVVLDEAYEAIGRYGCTLVQGLEITNAYTEPGPGKVTVKKAPPGKGFFVRRKW